MTTDRNLSPRAMFVQLALEHRPTLAFGGRTRSNFAAWKKKTLPAVVKTLGDWPKRVPLNPELKCEWEHDGLLKQRWHIDVGPHIAASFQINRPKRIRRGARLPAILCCHGHGEFGKEPVMGNDSSPELKAVIARHNYNYGHQMAKAGFVTFAIDWIGFGERNDSRKPHYSSANQGQDWCNLYYLNATMLGMTSLSINVTHGMAATDFACSFGFVDRNRLGVMGLSAGGTMALWMALCDERFKATEIICYSDLWRYFGFRDYNYCGMQVAPGLFKLVDLPDLQGLLAPRPLLVDIGIHDTCFLIEGAMQCYKKVRKIYRVAEAMGNLDLDLFPGEHAWGGNKSARFFGRWLSSGGDRNRDAR